MDHISAHPSPTKPVHAGPSYWPYPAVTCPPPASSSSRLVWDENLQQNIYIFFEGFFSGGDIIDREREIVYSTLSPPRLFTAYDTAPAGAPPASPSTQFSADRIWPLYQLGWLRMDYHDLHPSHYRKAPAFPDGAQNFLHEIQAYELFRARAQHPNLPEYFGCVVDEGYVVDLIVKEYPRTLAEAVESGDSEHLDDIMAQLEDVVKYVHSFGIAHNDISPWNIVLTSDLRPILIDFDTARPVGTLLCGLDKLGTPGFRNGGKDLTLSAFSNDFYSLGAIARYMRDGVVIDEASVPECVHHDAVSNPAHC